MTDLERGKQLYEEAKKLEFPHAWHDGMYIEELRRPMFGLYVGQKGHDMVAEAATLGYPEAQYQLGLFYFFHDEHKREMPKDYKEYDAWKQEVEDEKREGLQWMRKAAEQCHTEACLTLGHMYRNGYDIVSANESEAFAWYEIAAQAGDTEGMYWLGRCYYHGWGTAENNEAAFQQFLKAKNAGSTMMWCQLGECYMHGWGTGQNTPAAIDAFQKAIEKKDGFSDAARAGLACIYAGQNGYLNADPTKAFALASEVSPDSGGAYEVAQRILADRAAVEEGYRRWKQQNTPKPTPKSSASQSHPQKAGGASTKGIVLVVVIAIVAVIAAILITGAGGSGNSSYNDVDDDYPSNYEETEPAAPDPVPLSNPYHDCYAVHGGSVLPDSDSVYYEKSDLAHLNKQEMIIARNEIYARHGYIFKDEDLAEYFEACDWYSGTVSGSSFSDSVFNEYEKANIKTIVACEKDAGYRS